MTEQSFNGYEGIFATRFRNLLDEKKVTQNAIAIELGISRQAVSQYRNGETIPTADKIKKIADFFHVSADYLLGISDVETADTEIKAICEYTGLSEKAVEVLQCLNSDTKNIDYIVTLNQIIDGMRVEIPTLEYPVHINSHVSLLSVLSDYITLDNLNNSNSPVISVFKDGTIAYYGNGKILNSEFITHILSSEVLESVLLERVVKSLKMFRKANVEAKRNLLNTEGGLNGND